jgi:hypothetical protein
MWFVPMPISPFPGVPTMCEGSCGVTVSDGYVNARVVHFSRAGGFVRIIRGASTKGS